MGNVLMPRNREGWCNGIANLTGLAQTSPSKSRVFIKNTVLLTLSALLLGFEIITIK